MIKSSESRLSFGQVALGGLTKGWFTAASLAEDVCEGSEVRILMKSDWVNTPILTLVRQMAWAARPSNAPSESGRGVKVSSGRPLIAPVVSRG